MAALVWNVQVPRWTSAMLPAIAAALLSAAQPWFATPVLELTSTRLAVCPEGFGAPLPKPLESALYEPAIDGGEFTTTVVPLIPGSATAATEIVRAELAGVPWMK